MPNSPKRTGNWQVLRQKGKGQMSVLKSYTVTYMDDIIDAWKSMCLFELLYDREARCGK